MFLLIGIGTKVDNPVRIGNLMAGEITDTKEEQTLHTQLVIPQLSRSVFLPWEHAVLQLSEIRRAV